MRSILDTRKSFCYLWSAMEAFTYQNEILSTEGVDLEELAATYGTPLFVYSRAALEASIGSLQRAMEELNPLICYSVKANSNTAVIRVFAEHGAGTDIVSGGELFRALRAGVPSNRIVFAGVGKTEGEIRAALEADILFFTVESEPEARRISDIAADMHVRGRVAFRVNPDVDPQTHKYISTGKKENKFGLDVARVREACADAANMPGIDVVGIHMHIGSQILTPAPFVAALEKVTALCAELKEHHPNFKYLDIGGGLGIRYRPEDEPLAPGRFAESVLPLLRRTGLQVVMEPGRCLVGNAGILLCRVQYVKQNAFKHFIVVDAGMNDLLRPSLYQAHHEILSVRRKEGTVFGDVVGPICESGDFLATDRDLPAVGQGDLLAVLSAGAYGASMGSNYNSRPRPAEVMVDGENAQLIRRRETLEDLVLTEVGAG